MRPAAACDDLGPHSGKWDYFAADGQLLACVHPYDTSTGKQYLERSGAGWPDGD